MSTAIVTVVLTFVLTSLLGNWLLQRWQHRNWINQQTLLGEQKHYENLKELCDEILKLSNLRISKTRRLLSVVRYADDDLVVSRLAEYDSAVQSWNEQLGIFVVKLRFYARYQMAYRLDSEIQPSFVNRGAALESLVRTRREGRPISLAQIAALEVRLNDLNGLLIAYSRDLMNMLAEQKTRTYYGKKEQLKIDTLRHFPTWQLVKALFKTRVDQPSIVRSPSDL